MRISRSVGALAILAGCGCVDAFHCGPPPPTLSSSSLLRDVDVPSRSSSSSSSPSSSTMAIRGRTMSAVVVAAGRRSPRPVAASSSSSSSRSTRSRLREGAPSRDDGVRGSSSAGAASPTRREALRRFRDALLLSSTAAAAAALAWDSGRDASRASEFSDGPALEQQQQQQQQQLDKDGGSDSVATTILASDPSPSADDGIIALDDGASVVASSPSSSTAILAKSSSSDGEDGTAPMTPAQLKSSAVGAEVGLLAAAIFGMLFVVSGKTYPKNDDFTAVKARVVMIQPEPYGLEAGRRYYGGVYIRGDDPVPDCDYGVRVRSSCETGVVDDGCASAISDFLGEVARGGAGTDDGEGGGGPSEGQRETANAVLAYLDSLSSPPPSSDAPSSTTTTPPPPPASADGGPVSEAFSSYLDGLSRGEIDAPASPRLVADYLASLNEMRGRMIALESSVGRLPDEISGRLEHWQRERDGQLVRELVKIEEFLIKNRGADDGDGGGGGMDSVDMNGNVSVNEGYGSRAFFS